MIRKAALRRLREFLGVMKPFKWKPRSKTRGLVKSEAFRLHTEERARRKRLAA